MGVGKAPVCNFWTERLLKCSVYKRKIDLKTGEETTGIHHRAAKMPFENPNHIRCHRRVSGGSMLASGLLCYCPPIEDFQITLIREFFWEIEVVNDISRVLLPHDDAYTFQQGIHLIQECVPLEVRYHGFLLHDGINDHDALPGYQAGDGERAPIGAYQG